MRFDFWIIIRAMISLNLIKTKKTTADILHVKVATADHLIWTGDALSVSSKNSKGAFDILPRHQKFITLVHSDVIEVQTQGEKKNFQFATSIIYVNENSVAIYGNL